MKILNATAIFAFVFSSGPALADDLTIAYGQRFADRNCAGAMGHLSKGSDRVRRARQFIAIR